MLTVYHLMLENRWKQTSGRSLLAQANSYKLTSDQMRGTA
jgi:hypothetical protein